MNKTEGMNTGAGQSISRKTKFGLALIIAVAAAVGVVALFQPEPAARPASAVTPSAYTAAQEMGLARNRYEVLQSQLKSGAASSADYTPAQEMELAHNRYQLQQALGRNSAAASSSDYTAAQEMELARLRYAILQDRWLSRNQ